MQEKLLSGYVDGIYRKLMRVAVGYGMFVYVANSFLFIIMSNLPPIEILYTMWVILGGFILVIFADILGIRYFFNPIKHLSQQPVLSSEDNYRLFTYLINYPLITIIRVLTFHTLPPYSILLSGAVLFTNAGLVNFDLKEYMLTFSFIVVGIVAHAVMEYDASKRILLPLILELQPTVRELPPQYQSKIVKLGIYRRLSALSIWLMLIPMFVLGATLIIRMDAVLRDLGVADTLPYLLPMSLVAFIPALLMLIVMLFITRNTAREISIPADNLVTAMQTVAKGHLDVYLPITTADEFADLNRGFNNMVRGLQERERLHDAFGRYVSPELATQVREQGASLSAQVMIASVMFVDIRNFTPLAEKLSPIEVVTVLNRFFALVEPLIKQQGGWINKFLGDGFMVLFGVPVLDPAHAKHAVIVARKIREELVTLNTQHMGQFPPLSIGIGIDCGELVAGSIGSPDRIEYTVIGDVVNVASRIESLNKEFATTILISEAVYQLAGGVGACREMPLTPVKGKSTLVKVYALD